jgi:hypothetical protein
LQVTEQVLLERLNPDEQVWQTLEEEQVAQFATLQVTEHTLEARLKPVEQVWQTLA